MPKLKLITLETLFMSRLQGSYFTEGYLVLVNFKAIYI